MANTRSVSMTSQAAGRSHRLDMRLLHIRHFRRRKIHVVLNRHLSESYLAAPQQYVCSYGSDDHFLQSREPDPLVHPPA